MASVSRAQTNFTWTTNSLSTSTNWSASTSWTSGTAPTTYTGTNDLYFGVSGVGYNILDDLTGSVAEGEIFFTTGAGSNGYTINASGGAGLTLTGGNAVGTSNNNATLINNQTNNLETIYAPLYFENTNSVNVIDVSAGNQGGLDLVGGISPSSTYGTNLPVAANPPSSEYLKFEGSGNLTLGTNVAGTYGYEATSSNSSYGEELYLITTGTSTNTDTIYGIENNGVSDAGVDFGDSTTPTSYATTYYVEGQVLTTNTGGGTAAGLSLSIIGNDSAVHLDANMDTTSPFNDSNGEIQIFFGGGLSNTAPVSTLPYLGVTTITGSNNFFGITTVNSGTVILASTTALGGSGFSGTNGIAGVGGSLALNGGLVDLDGYSETVRTLTSLSLDYNNATNTGSTTNNFQATGGVLTNNGLSPVTLTIVVGSNSGLFFGGTIENGISQTAVAIAGQTFGGFVVPEYFTGTNTYTGATTIEPGGGLFLGNENNLPYGNNLSLYQTGSISGSSPIDIVGGSNPGAGGYTAGTLGESFFGVTESGNVTLANSISGLGGMLFQGTGNTTLTGINSEQGFFIINNGNVVLNNTAAGTSSNLIYNGVTSTITGLSYATGSTNVTVSGTLAGDNIQVGDWIYSNGLTGIVTATNGTTQFTISAATAAASAGGGEAIVYGGTAPVLSSNYTITTTGSLDQITLNSGTTSNLILGETVAFTTTNGITDLTIVGITSSNTFTVSNTINGQTPVSLAANPATINTLYLGDVLGNALPGFTPTNEVINGTNVLISGGANLTIVGGNGGVTTQAIGQLNLTNVGGANQGNGNTFDGNSASINLSPGANGNILVLNIGGISASGNAGGSLNINIPTNAYVSVANPDMPETGGYAPSSNGYLPLYLASGASGDGLYAVVNEDDFAVVDTNATPVDGTNLYNLVIPMSSVPSGTYSYIDIGAGTYTGPNLSGPDVIDVVTNGGTATFNPINNTNYQQVNAIRFNQAASDTVNFNTALNVGNGEFETLLVTPNVGSNTDYITGGPIRAENGGRPVVIYDYDTSPNSMLVIENSLAFGSGAEMFVLTGGGTVQLTATESLEQGANIDQGTLIATGNVVAPVVMTANFISGSYVLTDVSNINSLFVGEYIKQSLTNGVVYISAINPVADSVTITGTTNTTSTNITFEAYGGSALTNYGSAGASPFLGAGVNGVVVSGGATLQIGNGGSNGNLIANTAITNLGGTVALDWNGSGSPLNDFNTFYANINNSSTGGLAVLNPGSTVVVTSSNSTYTGGTVIGSGATVVVQQAIAGGTLGGTVSFSTGTNVLDISNVAGLQVGQTLSGTGLVANSNIIVAISGTNVYINGTTSAGNGGTYTSGAYGGTALGGNGSSGYSSVELNGTAVLNLGGNQYSGNSLLIGTTNSLTVGALTFNGGTLSNGIINTRFGAYSYGGVETASASITSTSTFFDQISGTTVLEGANTDPDGVEVNGGTLIAENGGALGAGGAITVTNGAALLYDAQTNAQLNLGASAVTFSGGSILGGSIGSSTTSDEILTTGKVTVTAPLTIDLYGQLGNTTTPTNGNYTVITGGSSSLAAFSATNYVLGTVYNDTDFTVGALTTTNVSGNTITVSITGATPLTSEYWVGGLLTGTQGTQLAASNGSTKSNWVTAASGGTNTPLVPGPTAVAYFGSEITTNQVLSLGASMSVAGISITSTSNITINPDYSQTGGAPIDGLIVGTNNLVFNTTATDTIAAPISGAAQIQTTNTGTLILTGQNTNTGGASIGAGSTLQVGNGSNTVFSSLGYSSTNGIVDNGALVYDPGTPITENNNISGTGTLTQEETSGTNSTGMTILTGTNTYTGNTYVTGNTLQIGNGTVGSISSSSAITVTNGATVAFDEATGSYNGSIADGGIVEGYEMGSTNSVVSTAITDTLGGNISGTGSFLQAGLGTTILSGTDTYTGSTVVTYGTLQIGYGSSSNTVTGSISSSSVITVSNAGTLVFDTTNGSVISNNIFTGTNNGSLAPGTVEGGEMLGNANTLTGVISGNGDFAQTGPGETVLSNLNTYSGGTTITTGTLEIDNGSLTTTTASAIGTGALYIDGGSIDSLTGAALGTANTQYWMNNFTFIGSSVLNLGTGTVYLMTSTNVALTVTTNTLIEPGSIMEGTTNNDGLTKQGAGTLLLSGANTYTGGTIVSAGTLEVTSGSALSTTGGVTVGSGAALVYDPTNSNLSLSLGSSTLTLASGATTLGASIGSTTNGNEIQTSGSVSATGSTVTVNLYEAPATSSTNGTYTLLTATGNGVNGASSYTLGTVYNDVNFTVGALSETASTLSVTLTSTNALTAEYWQGNVLSGTPGTQMAASNGSTMSNWSTTSNTYVATPLIPGSGGSVVAYVGSLDTTNQTVTLGASMNLAGLDITTSNVFNIAADGNSLTIGTNNLTVNSIANDTIAAPITGGGKLFFDDETSTTGTLTLTGSNTYTGATYAQKGTIILGPGGSLADQQVSLGAGGGVVGNLQLGSGTTPVNEETDSLIIATGGGTTSAVFGGSSAGISLLTVNPTITTSDLYIGNLGGSGANQNNLALTKAGLGTLNLSGTDTYIGPTTVTTGTLEFGTETSLYDDSNTMWTGTNIIVGNGATLALAVGGGGQFTSADITTLLGISSSAVTGFESGSILGLDTGTNTFTYAGAIANTYTGDALGLGLTKLGAGTLVLTGANSYSGVTTISAGTLQVGNGTIGSISNTNGITMSTTTNTVLEFEAANNSTYGGTISEGTTTNSSTYSIFGLESGSNVNTLSGVISGSGSFTQSGTGTTILSGQNTYTGATTVNAGTLSLGSTGSLLGSSGVTVTNGATLAAAGTNGGSSGVISGNVTLSGGGAITMQAATIGTLAINGSNGLTVGSASSPASTITLDITTGNGLVTPNVDLINFNGTPGTLVINGNTTITIANLTGVSSAILTPGQYLVIWPDSTITGTLGDLTLANSSIDGYGLSLTIGNAGPNNYYGVFLDVTGAPVVGYWTGATSASWATSSGTNFSTSSSTNTYSGGSPAYSTDIVFGTTSPTPTNLNTTLDQTTTINSLSFNTSSNVSIASDTNNDGAYSLTLDAATSTGYGGIDTTNNGIMDNANSGNVTISAPIILGTNQNWVSSSTNSLTVSGGVTGTASLNLQADSSGAITLSSNSVNPTGSITNTGTGTGITTISSVIGTNVTGGVTQNSATSELVLSGSNTYSGPTTITTGTLSLGSTGSLGGTGLVSVANGATLAAPGTANLIAGSVTVAGGGAINMQSTAIGALSIGGNLIIGNASTPSGLTFDITSGSSGNLDQIDVTGSVTLTGASGTTITIASLTGAGAPTLTDGIYDLITSGSLSGNTNDLVLTDTSFDGYTLSLITTSNAVELDVTGGVSPPAAAYWTGLAGTGTNSWTLAGNFSTTSGTNTPATLAPSSITDVVFGTTSPTPTNLNTTLDAATTINSLTFNTSSNVTIAPGAGGTLTLEAQTTASNTAPQAITVNNGAGADTISAPIILGTNQTWTNYGSNLFTVSGGVTGTANLTLQEGGASSGGITLSTNSVNPTGSITNMGSGSGETTISAVIGTNVTGVTENSATSTLLLTGTNLYTGATTVTTGTLQIGNGSTGSISNSSASTVSHGTLAFDEANGASYTGTIADGGTVEGLETSTNTNTLAGGISGTGSFTQAGPGTTLLTGSNTYTGATTISTGTLDLAATSGVAVDGTNVAVSSGTLNLDDGSRAQIVSTAIVTVTNGGTFNFGSANQNLAGVVNDGGTVNYGSGAKTIADPTWTTGTNTIGPGGPTTFSGGLGVSGGVNTIDSTNTTNSLLIVQSGASSTAGGAVTFFGTGTPNITLESNNVDPATLQVQGDIYDTDTTGTASITSSGSGTQAGVLDLSTTSAARGINVSAGGTLNIGTSIIDSSNNLGVNVNSASGYTGTNGGMVVFSGTATYTGATTINGGNLQVNGSTLSTGTITAASGGTLSGIGNVGNIVLSAGGEISPGNATTMLGTNLSSPTTTNNVLTGNSLTINGGTLSYNLYNVTPNTGLNSSNPAGGTVINLGSGLLTFSASLSSSNQLVLNFNDSASGGNGVVSNGALVSGTPNVYNLIEFGSSAGITDQAELTAALNDNEIVINNLAADLTPGDSAFLVLNTNIGDGQEALQLDVVPEPSTWAMFALGLGFLFFAVRKRMRLTRKQEVCVVVLRTKD